VVGDHEHYGHGLVTLPEALQAEANGTPIQVLENRVVSLGGVRFLGCTLWTDFGVGGKPAEAMRAAERVLSDYVQIQLPAVKRKLRAHDTAWLHAESVVWLEEQLTRGDPARTVVVTHHAPSPRSEAPYHATSPIRGAFTSDLEWLIESSRVALWVHGHTHHNIDYRLGNTRVVSNQLGYPDQACHGFDPGMVIEI
jgi:Icc-related predicted phosphoesterase